MKQQYAFQTYLVSRTMINPSFLKGHVADFPESAFQLDILIVWDLIASCRSSPLVGNKTRSNTFQES